MTTRTPTAVLGRMQWLGICAAPMLALVTYIMLPGVPGADVTPAPGVLSQTGRLTIAVAVWMACWWMTEAIPLAATALLPIALFPLLGVASIREATAPYSHPLLYLFMGGFILGLGLQRWGVHRRVALVTVLKIGTRPMYLVAGFMLAAALLSMWVSNTATVIMMLPIAVSLLDTLRGNVVFEGSKDGALSPDMDRFPNLAPALMLGIAYAASIGGLATLIGSPPNLVLASFVADHYGADITMLEWLRVGLPIVVVFLPVTWIFLTRFAFPVPRQAIPGARERLVAEVQKLGVVSRGEKVVLTVFATTALAWALRPQLVAVTGLSGLTDAGIAVAGALVLFAVPVDLESRTFAMDWETAMRLPWGILILFGGGLSLASAISANGVDTWLAQGLLGIASTPALVVTLAVSALVVFLTEITSNTAVTSTLLPVLAGVAAAADVPAGLLLATAALSASCAFMLPVATPPNAIVFSSGQVTIPQMIKAGIVLNVIAIFLLSFFVYFCNCTLGLTGE